MFGSGKKGKIAVVFDIGSSSVGGAYALFAPGAKPKILHSVREDMVFQKEIKFDRLVSSMLDALSRVGNGLMKYHLPLFSEKFFVCSFSSPWYASQTRVASLEKETSFLVTEKLLADMLAGQIDEFKQMEFKRLDGNAKIIEKEMMQIRLNGYETEVPSAKTAKTVEMSAYLSVLPEQIFSSVDNAIREMFHERNVRWHSFPFVAFVVIRDIFHESGFLFVDISGEVTDVSIIRGGVLEETASFPYGKNFLIRRVASGLSLSPLEAISELGMHWNGDTHEKNADKLNTLLSLAEEEWQKGFRQTLSSFARAGMLLPADVFFTADTDVCDWFAENIAKDKMVQYTNTEDMFRVHSLQAPFFASLCDFEKGAMRDPFLALGTVFAQRLSNN